MATLGAKEVSVEITGGDSIPGEVMRGLVSTVYYGYGDAPQLTGEWMSFSKSRRCALKGRINIDCYHDIFVYGREGKRGNLCDHSPY